MTTNRRSFLRGLLATGAVGAMPAMPIIAALSQPEIEYVEVNSMVYQYNKRIGAYASGEFMYKREVALVKPKWHGDYLIYETDVIDYGDDGRRVIARLAKIHKKDIANLIRKAKT